ncbi:hypothetical protein [Phenylobacterium sp.]|uniref:hypothetical protein n=1 Tax=Phenylobacterium sp. TaxID=1871053 RepID=UPI0035B0EE8D
MSRPLAAFAHRTDARVQDFTLYGLDEKGTVVSAEHIVVPGVAEAIALARGRLARFPRIEVWQESVCVYRGPKTGDGT